MCARGRREGGEVEFWVEKRQAVVVVRAMPFFGSFLQASSRGFESRIRSALLTTQAFACLHCLGSSAQREMLPLCALVSRWFVERRRSAKTALSKEIEFNLLAPVDAAASQEPSADASLDAPRTPSCRRATSRRSETRPGAASLNRECRGKRGKEEVLAVAWRRKKGKNQKTGLFAS